MEWYWWVLIIAVVVGLVTLKVLSSPKYQKEKREDTDCRKPSGENE